MGRSPPISQKMNDKDQTRISELVTYRRSDDPEKFNRIARECGFTSDEIERGIMLDYLPADSTNVKPQCILYTTGGKAINP